MSNIRSLELYERNIWDWTFLNQCFRGGIRVSDLDGIVERNGYFLVIETKYPNKPYSIPTGQKRMFEAFQKTGKFTVLVLWGKPNQPEFLQIFATDGRVVRNKTSESKVQNYVSRWFKWADDKEIAA